MKLKIKLPSGLDATNVEFDEANNELIMDLIFYGDGKETVGGVVMTTGDDGDILFRGIIKINGKTAHVSITDRTKQVKPIVERKIKKA